MTSRVYVYYGGIQYTISGSSASTVRGAITQAVNSGEPHWLRAHAGEGRAVPAELLITTGIPIVISDSGVEEEDGEID